LLPERDSDPVSRRLATQLADQLGISHVVEDIAPTLEGAGCYTRRDEAARQAEPAYGTGWRCKLVLPGRGDGSQLNVSSLQVCAPGGEPYQVRLPAGAYRQLVAAVNFKQRVRKMFEYYHADRLHYAVIGTPNRLEYDQGFFVKGGDGLADIKPIAHLYKSQAYAIARHLDLPAEIISRPPTTDTFSLPQSQEEFYFSLPHAQLDVALHGFNSGRPAADVAAELGLDLSVIERTYRDIVQKRTTTHSLHVTSLLVEPVQLGVGDAA
jgi:NAD+ synthase